MPQWRKLHAKVVESIDVNEMPDDFTRLLWVLLPTQLCCHGRGQDYPAWIRARVFPLRQDVTLDMVEAAMTWYAGRGMLLRYQVAGRPYFQLANWSRYQGNTSREAPSDYPPPDGSPGDERPAERDGPCRGAACPARPESDRGEHRQGSPAPYPAATQAEPLPNARPTRELPRPDACPADESRKRKSRAPNARRRSHSRLDADAERDADSDAAAEHGAGAPVLSLAEGPDRHEPARSPPVPSHAEGPDPAAAGVPARKPKSPPAVLAFRRAAHRYPPKSWYADVDSAVGREEPDLQFWEQVVKEWVGHGWNPTNVSGMLDCYTRRQLPGRGPRAAGPPADPIQAAIQAIEEEGWT